MKKLFLLLVVFVVSFSSVNANNDDSKIFLGKWNIEMFNTPNGDVKSVLNLEMKEGKLAGKLETEDGNFDLHTISVKDKQLTFSFTFEYNDIEIIVKLTSDDKFEGYAMEMLEVAGERIK